MAAVDEYPMRWDVMRLGTRTRFQSIRGYHMTRVDRIYSLIIEPRATPEEKGRQHTMG